MPETIQLSKQSPSFDGGNPLQQQSIGRSASPPPFQLQASEGAEASEVSMQVLPGLANDLPIARRGVIQALWATVQGSSGGKINLRSTGKSDSSGRALYENSSTKEIYVLVDASKGIVQKVSSTSSSSSTVVPMDDFDSDDESDYKGINSAQINGLKKSQKSYHVSNSNGWSSSKTSTSKLEADAKLIHKANGGWSATTVVCGQFIAKNGKFLKIMTCNAKMLGPKGRQMAESLGYVVILGTKTHAEANMMTYAHKHRNDLKFINHGCDKGACKMCQTLLTTQYGSSVDFGSMGTTGNLTGTYYHQGMSSLSSPQVQSMVGQVQGFYNSNGKKK